MSTIKIFCERCGKHLVRDVDGQVLPSHIACSCGNYIAWSCSELPQGHYVRAWEIHRPRQEDWEWGRKIA